MKKLLLSLLFLAFSLEADYIKETIGACKDEANLPILKKYAKKYGLEKGGLELELLIIKLDCRILDKNIKIDVLDYTGEKEDVLKLVLKKTGEIYFAFNKGIQIEQPGQNNIIYKF